MNQTLEHLSGLQMNRDNKMPIQKSHTHYKVTQKSTALAKKMSNSYMPLPTKISIN
jgi:hypothetical protein